ncbi:unnamed protein product [Mesocestoides corti]|uniref:Homeobox domain-containing protein n=1 Tax=Mesocestoides corti TaxID=53468 RepID=A0A0R3UD52_MESCO|nr:unnamed protein product [Mesocestoides corti]
MSASQSGEPSKHIAKDRRLSKFQPRWHSGCDASPQTHSKSFGDGTIGNTLDSEQYGEEQIEPLDLSVRHKPPPATTSGAPSAYLHETNANLLFPILLQPLGTRVQTHLTKFHEFAVKVCMQIDSKIHDFAATRDTQHASTFSVQYSIDDCTFESTSIPGTRKRKFRRFSDDQIWELENRYYKNNKISLSECDELGGRLGLSGSQVM